MAASDIAIRLNWITNLLLVPASSEPIQYLRRARVNRPGKLSPQLLEHEGLEPLSQDRGSDRG